jgi:hypothetical protein
MLYKFVITKKMLLLVQNINIEKSAAILYLFNWDLILTNN